MKRLFAVLAVVATVVPLLLVGQSVAADVPERRSSTVSGVVVDPEGQPVAGALVEWFYAGYDAGPRDYYSFADENGRFSVPFSDAAAEAGCSPAATSTTLSWVRRGTAATRCALRR